MPARKTTALPARPLASRSDAGQYLGAGSGAGGIRQGILSRFGGSPLVPIVALVAVALIAFGAYRIINPPTYQITLNGQAETVDRDATIQDLIDTGKAAPTAGNLLAVDGSLITQGGGTPFSAKVNDEEVTDAAFVVPKDAQVEIGDGSDVTEEFTTAEETIKHGTASSSTKMEAYWSGSLHVYSKGVDGVRTVKTGNTSGKKVSETTKAAVPAGYNIYTANVGNDKVIALTFDDGPWPDTTKQILDIMEKNSAKCTFFTIGNQVAEHADQVKRAKQLGCEVCTHTWDHAAGSGQGVNLTYMSEDEQISEVKKGYKAIKDATGEEPPHIMRAPGGNYFGDLITTLEPYVDAEIGWDTDTEDWRRPGTNAIYKSIMKTKSGQVVLMHDGGGDRSQTVAAVKKAVPELVKQGYKLVTVSELLAYDPPQSTK